MMNPTKRVETRHLNKRSAPKWQRMISSTTNRVPKTTIKCKMIKINSALIKSLIISILMINQGSLRRRIISGTMRINTSTIKTEARQEAVRVKYSNNRQKT